MIPAKIYKFIVPANGAYTLLVSGSFFKILSSTAAVSVRSDQLGTIGELLAGQGVERAPFNSLLFTGSSGFANEVRVIVAADTFIDDRISGEVSVIDGGKARTLAGAVFGGRVGAAAGATEYAQVQFWNPPGSNRRVIVGSFNVLCPAGSALVGIGSVAMAGASVPLLVQSKLSGGSAGVTEQRFVNSAVYTAMNQLNQATTGVQISDPEPYVLLPGYGFNVLATALNITMFASAHIIEEVL